MKLCYMYDDGFVPLRTHFLDNLKDTFELIEKKLDTPKFETDFHQHRLFGGGIQVWKDKVKFLLETIDICEPNEYFVYSDVDVIFFKPIIPILNEVLNNKDVVFIREIPHGSLPQQGGDVAGHCNFGFCVVKACDKSKRFFQDVLHMIENTKNFVDSHDHALWPDGLMDQTCVNRILFSNPDYDLNWGTLPLTFTTTAYETYNMINKDTVAYHATCVIEVNKKIELLNLFKQKVMG